MYALPLALRFCNMYLLYSGDSEPIYLEVDFLGSICILSCGDNVCVHGFGVGPCDDCKHSIDLSKILEKFAFKRQIIYSLFNIKVKCPFQYFSMR